MYTSFVMILTNYYRVATHNTVFLLLFKAGTKLDKGGVSGGLLNDLSKGLE